MARTTKKKTTKEEASFKVNKTTDDNDVNKEWLVIAMLAHNLLGEVIEELKAEILLFLTNQHLILKNLKTKLVLLKQLLKKHSMNKKKLQIIPKRKIES